MRPSRGISRRSGWLVAFGTLLLVVLPITGCTAVDTPIESRPEPAPAPASRRAGTSAPSATPSTGSDSPSEDPLASLADLRVAFGHQSVGDNIIAGLSASYAAAGLARPDIVRSRTPHSGDAPAVFHMDIGRNGDPIGKIDDFAAVLGNGMGESVDVALMKLCYVDINRSTDVVAVFKKYRSTMAALEKAYPEVTFLYTTTPLTTEEGAEAVRRSDIDSVKGGPLASGNMARERYNALVRQEYAATGRLFDIAALEAQRDDGRVMAGSHGDVHYYVLNPDLSRDRGHLNKKGSRQLATALVQVIAEARARG